MMELITGLLAVFLALVHLFAGLLACLRRVPRNHWFSFAGGASVAYVFIQLLPELTEWQATVEEVAADPVLLYLQHHVYLMALLGLMLFYGIERAVTVIRKSYRETGLDSPAVFWVHIAVFGFYNALIGYLLIRGDIFAVGNVYLYTLAIGLHFLVNDYGLRAHHQDDYDHTGRWVLSGAVIIGWAAGLLFALSDIVLAGLFAFLAGGIILNVLKEELPEERESRFWAFAAGAIIYVLLVQIAG